MREHNGEAARRAYWAEAMDKAYEFMEAIAEYPVEECGEAMAPLREAAEEAGVEVKFSPTKLADRFERLFWLRKGLVKPFVALAREMNEEGWILLVEDAYRTAEMQTALGRAPKIFDVILEKVVWELGGKTPGPDLMRRRVTALVATRPKIGTHMSGSALDISVLSRETGAELYRGAPYIELSEKTPMDSPMVSGEARKNRHEITVMMAKHGFVAYPFEFWHYSAGDAYQAYLDKTGKPARYGAVDMDPATGKVTAMADPMRWLHGLDGIEAEIAAAMKRRSGGQ